MLKQIISLSLACLALLASAKPTVEVDATATILEFFTHH